MLNIQNKLFNSWSDWGVCNLPLFVLSRDGLISKDEMIAYFLRANPLLQCKMGPGFIHNFQEMNYLKPTFCEHCAGFVRISSVLSLHASDVYSFGSRAEVTSVSAMQEFKTAIHDIFFVSATLLCERLVYIFALCNLRLLLSPQPVTKAHFSQIL